MAARVLLIDNYDSFTHNLYQYLGALGAEVEVVRNDELDLAAIVARAPTHIVISPGPGHPARAADFGVCAQVIAQLEQLPILGVCLGHQGIALNEGGRVVRAPSVMHGKTDCIEHNGDGLFDGLPQPLEVMRYHSWIVEAQSLPESLVVTARNCDGLIMAMQHRHRPLFGVQFHPESIGTPSGQSLLQNFLSVPSPKAHEAPFAPAIRVRVPSSKSLTHRAFLLAARCKQPCEVQSPLLGADTEATLNVLTKLGAHREDHGAHVRLSCASGWGAPGRALECGNSGTTLRLLSAQVATLTQPVRLDGDHSLRSRPNGALLSALEQLGARCSSDEGRAPLTVQGPLRPGRVTLPSRTSSQFASALLLASALGPRGITTVELLRPISSRPYLDLTFDTARAFGLEFMTRESARSLTLEVPGGQVPSAASYEVEGDWSAAAFPAVAAALSGRSVVMHGLQAHSRQGDRQLMSLLPRFGQAPSWTQDNLHMQPQSIVGAGEVDLSAAPDLFPALVALAACAQGETNFVNAPQLRHKECDRIAAMQAGLQALGVRCAARPDGLQVWGCASLRPAQLQSHLDHRVHMAFSLLRLRQPGVVVDGLGCEAVSYPRFHQDLAAFMAQT